MTVDEFVDEVKEYHPIKNRIFKNINWDFSNAIFNEVYTITFIKCDFHGIFTLSNLTNTEIRIEFYDCSFQLSSGAYFSTINCQVILFKNCSGQALSFISCIFEELIIEDITISKNFRILDCEIGKLLVSNEETGQINSFFLNSQNVKEAQIHSFSKIDQLLLYGLQKAYISGNYKFVDFNIQNFGTIEFSSLEKNEDIFLPTTIEKFNISDLTFSGLLTLNEINIQNLTLSNVTSSSGTIRLTEVFIENTRFDDCSISSFYWNQVHFEKKLDIARCDFSGLKLTNVKWLHENKVSQSYLDLPVEWFYSLRKKELLKKELLFDKEELMMLQYERDTYRQLKAASIANHNDIEALDFYRNEMRLYWKEIRINGGVKWHDRVLVFLNRWVSDFGQNWWLPLVWMFGLHTLIYFCIIDFHFTASWTDFKNGGGQYFELLNPVHKTPGYIKGFYVGLELLMRILNGFFIYHFIRATRKFSKL